MMKSRIKINNFNQLIQQALYLHQAGRLDEAAMQYKKLLKTEPFHPQLLSGLGTIALQQGNFELANQLLAKSIQVYANQPIAYCNRGTALAKLNRQAEALASYDLAIALSPEYALAHNNRGLAHHALQQYEAAVDAYNQAIAIKPDYAECYYNRALTFQALKQYAEARDGYQHAIKLKSDFADAYYNLAITLKALQQFDAAILAYDKAIALKPDYAEAYCNRGLTLHELKNFEAALDSYDRAISISPDFAEAYHNRGLAFHELQQFAVAVDNFNKAINTKPDFAEAYHSRGLTYKALKQFDESISSYEQAIAAKPDYVEAYINLGLVLQEIQQYEAALCSYDQALSLKPDYADAYINLGIALQDRQQYAEAIVNYDRALTIKPDYVEAYINRGLAFQALQQYELALASVDAALNLKPDYAEAYNNRGIVLHELQRLELAKQAFKQAISIKSEYAEAHYNLGLVYVDQLCTEQASDCFDTAIALKPDYASAYWDKALLKILTGDYEEGWRLYEWRWQDQQKNQVRHFSQPLWTGQQAIHDKILLIQAEQGLGDMIQFCRYVPMLADLAAKVLLEAPSSLLSLLSSLKGDFTLVEQGKALPSFDVYCPVMSLPLAFKTTLSNVPADVPYLYSHEEKQTLWQARLGKKAKFRVGLVWSGSSAHKNDHNRSIPLKSLKPLFAGAVEFHALQKEIKPDDLAELSHCPNLYLHRDALQDFSDTAALIDSMDLIIAVDTSVAHLAGALSKPVWILLPFRPDYRWMLEAPDSPWYPSATLFRQSVMGDWDSVVLKVLKTLQTLQ